MPSPAFQIASKIDMLTHIIDAVRHGHICHRYGDGDPHIYADLGTGSPILYTYGDPIHINRVPKPTKGSPYPP